jgi:hypothetical protein
MVSASRPYTDLLDRSIPPFVGRILEHSSFWIEVERYRVVGAVLASAQTVQPLSN